MAYAAEECDDTSIGAAMGLYIGGSAVGGMLGRLGAAVLSEYLGWRWAFAGLGLASLVAAACFSQAAPPSQSFVSRRTSIASFAASTRRLLGDKALPWLDAEGCLLMGAFVTIYNYAGYRLLAPPYSLSQSAVGAIFLLYIVGSISSTWVGTVAGRLGRRKVLWMPIAVLLVGVALTAARPLVVIILGIAVVTGGFFGAHSVASGWVGRRTLHDRAQASSLYLLSYYLGSSILGSVGGFAWSSAGWPGVVTFAMALVAIALAIALRLTKVKPLTDTQQASGVEAGAAVR